MNERRLKLIEMLDEAGSLEVVTLATELGVSAVTIRKDLEILENKNLVRRHHGYAASVSREDIGYRMTFGYETKKRIAERAAQMVHNGETIMIESGSTCAMLAMELAEKRRGITIVTNSAFIASYIRRLPGARSVLLGGSFNPDAQVMTGPLVQLCAQNFFVDKFFIGTDGFDPSQGFFSNLDLPRAEAVHAMGKHAQHKIILTDSTKFNHRSVVVLLPATEISAVITDSVPENCRAHLEQSGVDIILA